MKNGKPRRDSALLAAIHHAGGVGRLAKALKIRSQAVSKWTRAPAARVIGIERACAAKVSRYELRPDIYPPPNPEPRAAE